jgi:hypothetical protein
MAILDFILAGVMGRLPAAERPLKCRICPAIIGAVIGNCPSG